MTTGMFIWFCVINPILTLVSICMAFYMGHEFGWFKAARYHEERIAKEKSEREKPIQQQATELLSITS